jgi:thiol-disulfide isomerase/thioredoxin
MRRAGIAAAVLIPALSALAAAAAVQSTLTTGPRPNTALVGRLALAPGDEVRPVYVLNLDGTESEVSWAGSKLTLVNLWSTWCVPCREEMPGLEKIHAGHPASDLTVLGVVVMDHAPVSAVKSAADAAKATYRIVVDSEKDTQRAFGGVATVPTSFLVDSKGTILRKFVGTSPKQLEALSKDVDDVLAGRPLGAPYLPPPDEPPAAAH